MKMMNIPSNKKDRKKFFDEIINGGGHSFSSLSKKNSPKPKPRKRRKKKSEIVSLDWRGSEAVHAPPKSITIRSRSSVSPEPATPATPETPIRMKVRELEPHLTRAEYKELTIREKFDLLKKGLYETGQTGKTKRDWFLHDMWANNIIMRSFIKNGEITLEEVKDDKEMNEDLKFEDEVIAYIKKTYPDYVYTGDKKGKGKRKSTEVQSVVFKREDFTLKQAKKWLKSHGYKITFKGKNVDKKNKSQWRFRQTEPSKYNDYRTKEMGNTGVSLVLGLLKGKGKSDEPIDWDDIKWGSFTEQFNRFKEQHPKTKLKDLGDFAEMILKNKDKYTKKTEKRANFYVNVLDDDKVKGKGFWSDLGQGVMSVVKPVAKVAKIVGSTGILGPQGMIASAGLAALGAGGKSKNRLLRGGADTPPTSSDEEITSDEENISDEEFASSEESSDEEHMEQVQQAQQSWFLFVDTIGGLLQMNVNNWNTFDGPGAEAYNWWMDAIENDPIGLTQQEIIDLAHDYYEEELLEPVFEGEWDPDPADDDHPDAEAEGPEHTDHEESGGNLNNYESSEIGGYESSLDGGKGKSKNRLLKGGADLGQEINIIHVQPQPTIGQLWNRFLDQIEDLGINLNDFEPHMEDAFIFLGGNIEDVQAANHNMDYTLENAVEAANLFVHANNIEIPEPVEEGPENTDNEGSGDDIGGYESSLNGGKGVLKGGADEGQEINLNGLDEGPLLVEDEGVGLQHYWDIFRERIQELGIEFDQFEPHAEAAWNFLAQSIENVEQGNGIPFNDELAEASADDWAVHIFDIEIPDTPPNSDEEGEELLEELGPQAIDHVESADDIGGYESSLDGGKGILKGGAREPIDRDLSIRLRTRFFGPNPNGDILTILQIRYLMERGQITPVQRRLVQPQWVVETPPTSDDEDAAYRVPPAAASEHREGRRERGQRGSDERIPEALGVNFNFDSDSDDWAVPEPAPAAAASSPGAAARIAAAAAMNDAAEVREETNESESDNDTDDPPSIRRSTKRPRRGGRFKLPGTYDLQEESYY